MAPTNTRDDRSASVDTPRRERRSYLSTAIPFWPLFLIAALALSGLEFWRQAQAPSPPAVYKASAVLLTLGEAPALTYEYLPNLASVRGDAWQRAYRSAGNPNADPNASNGKADSNANDPNAGRKPVPAMIGDGIDEHYRFTYIDHYLLVDAYARDSADAINLVNGMADSVAAMGQRIRASELAALQLEAERWPNVVGVGTPVLSGRVSVVERAVTAEGPMPLSGEGTWNGLGIWGKVLVKGLVGALLAGFAVLAVWVVRERLWEVE